MDVDTNKVCIIGMGYVGLTLAGTLGEVSVEVIGIDRNEAIIATLNSGRCHLHEVGLQPLIARLIAAGRLRFSTDVRVARDCSIFIIAVGTPVVAGGGVDLTALTDAITAVAEVMPPDSLVVLRSTVQVGATDGLVNDILRASGKPFELAFCPERTIEGQALAELRRLPQIIGGLTDCAVMRASQLFSLLTPAIVKVSSAATAEVIKLVDNTSRDIGFSVANEIAMFCDRMSIDAVEVIRQGAQGYERVSLPLPGPVGGPCLSKDPLIFVQSMVPSGRTPVLAATARAVNKSVPAHVAEEVSRWASWSASSSASALRVVLLGMAFKGRPETDDLRGTTTLDVQAALAEQIPRVRFVAWDPVVKPEAIRATGIAPAESMEAAFDQADIVVIANNHPIWSRIDLPQLASRMTNPGLVYDLWNNFERRTLSLPAGITYVSLGRHCKPIVGGRDQ